MKLPFTKMHGAGNDFVVLDGINQIFSLTTEQIRHIADRHFGVGCDQLLLVEKASVADADFRYRIFNADGGEVEQCGNGARCFVRFVHDVGLTQKTEIRVQTMCGMITLKLEADDTVTVNMGAPCFAPEKIPFLANSQALTYALPLGNQAVEIGALSMGNPHAVQVVSDVESAPVLVQGAEIERHTQFPQRVNAGFMQVMNRQHIKLRVYERGAGETLACGTGACAAVVHGIQLGLLDSPVKVSARGGELNIAWAGDEQPVMMSGAAVVVFKGEINV
ncbi:MAG: diaminopimelate epimerase [Methylophilaceae bacterium]